MSDVVWQCLQAAADILDPLPTKYSKTETIGGLDV